MWTHTHHQKLLVVDQWIAILGKFDFALTKYDTPSHPPIDPKSSVRPGTDLFVGGIPYITNVNQYFDDEMGDVVRYRAEVSTRNWQDVSV